MIELSKWQFSVIYSVDVIRDVRLTGGCWLPSHRNLFQTTETGASEDYKGGKHRKLCGLLNLEQLKRMISELSLHWSGQGSSLGSPGCGLGIVPAAVFSDWEETGQADLNVTPVPPDDYKGPKIRERQWKEIISWMSANLV